MKRNVFLFVMAAMAFSAIVSCTKEEMERNRPVIEITGNSSWSFTATVEEPGTKMSYNSSARTFAWEESDKVLILWDGGSTTATASVVEGVASFTPSGDLPAEGTPIWLTYPSSTGASISGGNLVLPMPSVLEWPAYLVAKASVGDVLVSFNHPFCYYAFNRNGDGTDVSRLVLTSSDSNNITAESVTLSLDGSGKPAIASSAGGSKTITADFAGNDERLFYVPVLPGAVASGKLKFQFMRTENAAHVNAGAYIHNAATTNARASILDWADLPAKATNRYVSTTGSGTKVGTIENKWDWDALKGFMENSSSRTDNQLALYNGVNVHFESGTYTPSAKINPTIKNIRINLIGGGNKETIIDGSSNKIIFDIYQWAARGLEISFKNIVFRNAKNSAAKESGAGGAFRIGTNTSDTRTFTITFEDCLFSNNQASNATYGNGGAFWFGYGAIVSFKNCGFIKNTAAVNGGVAAIEYAAVVSFDNCSFGADNDDSRNTAANGGVLYNNGSETVTVTGGSTFIGNKATTGHGGAVYMVQGSLVLEDSTFDSNSVGSIKQGGAIYCNASAACSIRADEVSFINNHTAVTLENNNDRGGAICAFGADGNIVSLELTDCRFSGNSAGRMGTAVSVEYYCFIKANRCLFVGNTGGSRGTVRYGNNSLAFFNDCSFYNNTASEATTWGIALHGGATGATCMNNCTIYNNTCTNASPTANNVAINGDSPLLLVNSTVIGNTAYLLRANNQYYRLCNSILVNTGTAANIYHSQTGDKYSSGHNAMSGSCGGDIASDLTSCTLSDFVGGAWSSNTMSSPYYGVFSWTNSGITGFSPAVESDITDAIDDFVPSVSAVGVSNVGSEFKTWLNGMTPKGYATDGRGETRTGSWWPGAYQQN